MTGSHVGDHANVPAEQGGRLSDSTRVEAFSDGVLAIAITLLVLDLRAPWPGDMRKQLPGEWRA